MANRLSVSSSLNLFVRMIGSFHNLAHHVHMKFLQEKCRFGSMGGPTIIHLYVNGRVCLRLDFPCWHSWTTIRIIKKNNLSCARQISRSVKIWGQCSATMFPSYFQNDVLTCMHVKFFNKKKAILPECLQCRKKLYTREDLESCHKSREESSDLPKILPLQGKGGAGLRHSAVFLLRFHHPEEDSHLIEHLSTSLDLLYYSLASSCC